MPLSDAHPNREPPTFLVMVSKAVPAPPPAFPGDVTYTLGNLIAGWIVGPLYGAF